MKKIVPLILILAVLVAVAAFLLPLFMGHIRDSSMAGLKLGRPAPAAYVAGAGGMDDESWAMAPSDFDKASDAEPAPSQTPVAEVEPRKVIYTATFGMVVGDVRYVQDKIKALAEQLGGYMQHMSGNSIVIRVPAEKFEQVEGMLAKYGTVTGRDMSAEDVTELYYDMEVRLKNARALADRLREIIKQAANTSDLLAAEKELARVTEEIERLEGRLNRLRNRISYATVIVNLSRAREAPAVEVGGRLPFGWLHDLGLDSLLNFEPYD